MKQNLKICKKCNSKGIKEDMIRVSTGRNNKGKETWHYFHPDCYKEWEK